MELAPWAPYGTNTVLDLRRQRNRPRQGDLQPDLRARPDQLRAQVAARPCFTLRGWLPSPTPRPAPRAAAPGAWPPAAAPQPGRARLRRPLRPRSSSSCLAAPLWADHVADTGPNQTHTLEKIEVDGEKREVVNRRRQADRAGLARRRRQVLPRRRRPARPRRDGAADVRRAHLAASSASPRRCSRPLLATVLAPARRLLPRLGRHGHLADAGRDLGLPGDPAGNRARASRLPSAACRSGRSRSPAARSGSRS